MVDIENQIKNISSYVHTASTTKRSSPLIVGVGDNENFLASDKNALPPHVKNIVYLKDEQIVSISNKDFKVFYLNSTTSLNGYSLLKEVESLAFHLN